MYKHTRLLGAALTTLMLHPAQAAEVAFSGGASGVDPLGHAYSFDGTTFRLASAIGDFNPAHTPIGSGTSAASFSFTLTGPTVFDPGPVLLPNACPPGQYAVYLSLNPLVIVCMGFSGGGPFIRNTWQYSMRSPGVGTFDGPVDGSLAAGVSDFQFTLTFPEPVATGSFSFNAAWSDVSAVPEPVGATLMLLGLAGLAAGRRWWPAPAAAHSP
jgi:hypothetical protein